MITPVTYVNNKVFTAYGYFKNKTIHKTSENLLEVDWVN